MVKARSDIRTGWEGPEETNQVTGCLNLGVYLFRFVFAFEW